jgi:hypothetical protein
MILIRSLQHKAKMVRWLFTKRVKRKSRLDSMMVLLNRLNTSSSQGAVSCQTQFGPTSISLLYLYSFSIWARSKCPKFVYSVPT